MAIGDLTTEKGLKGLDAYMADKSYVDGYMATLADLAVFEAVGKAPGTNTPHALRWYNHIKNLGEETKKNLSGIKKAPAAFGNLEPAPATKAAAPAKKEDDDDIDLFGSDDEEDAEAAKVREERLKAYAEKKSKKPGIIAKSSIVLDVKPWDDETDMGVMEQKVRTIVKDGLVWGASKLVPVGYGIKKLQIMCVVEDDKVSVDELVEDIQEFEDCVQSVDIAAFNKI